MTKRDETVTVLPLENIRHARAEIPSVPAADAKTPWGQPRRTFTVTDMALVDGELYVAGLGNEEFASTLRRLPYPFGKTPSITTVEMFHTSHDRYETAAPIESFLPISLARTSRQVLATSPWRSWACCSSTTTTPATSSCSSATSRTGRSMS